METIHMSSGRAEVILQCCDGPCQHFMGCVYSQTRKEMTKLHPQMESTMVYPNVVIEVRDGIAHVSCKSYKRGKMMEEGE